jgi:hypothetical protein
MQDQMQDRMDNKNSIKKKLERFAGGGGMCTGVDRVGKVSGGRGPTGLFARFDRGIPKLSR